MIKPVVLIVLDGFGIAPPGPGNAVYLANPMNINSFFQSFPHTTLKASGEAVGLPMGEVGNTEVGHINLGAGRIVYQDLPRINMSIADGSFFQNEAIMKGILHVKKTGGDFHVIGLVGEGAVHSAIDHLYALLYMAREQRLNQVFVHAITDGRDSPPKAAAGTIKRVEEKLTQSKIGKIASIMGRYYAMDRDRRWERIEKAYSCLTEAKGQTAPSAAEAISQAYNESKTDEFIEPTVILENGKPVATIKKGDAVVFFNYRIDRPRELTKAFVLDDFEKQANITTSFDPYAVKYYKTHAPKEPILTPPFKREKKIENLFFITMTEYEKNLPVEIAFPPIMVNMPVGRVIADAETRQMRMSESEKERFVTFYFNGQREVAFEKEERLIVPSPKVPTYDLKPEMSAREVTQLLLTKMRSRTYPFILVNFANADMVGHTGNIEASIMAVKTLDECLGEIVTLGLAYDYTIMITADHGNVEQKINPQTGQISTEHTDNPVPFLAINKKFQGKNTKLQTGILSDVAPTVLTQMEIPKPSTMTGRNLMEEMR